MERIFEYRMRPNRAQESALFTVLAASRRLYNDALAEWKAHFETTGKYLTMYVQDKRYNKATYENPRAYKRSLERLAKAQQRLAHRKKGSRRRKAARNVARIHEEIANQRKDVLHKVSRKYVNQYQTIVVEDLQPANMVKNHALAQTISDSSWGMLRAYLSYKAAEAG